MQTYLYINYFFKKKKKHRKKFPDDLSYQDIVLMRTCSRLNKDRIAVWKDLVQCDPSNLKDFRDSFSF